MEENYLLKQKIYWIGQHAYDLYLNTDTLIVDNYVNEILLFERIESNQFHQKEIVFLDEFFPLQDRNYNVEDLITPISKFMKDRNIPFENGLIIGDASEILVQAFVEIGTFDLSEIQNVEVEAAFDFVHRIDSTNSLEMVDVSGFSILFLKEAVPFKDTVELALHYKDKASKTFNKIIVSKINDLKLNEFLFHLENGVEEAVDLSEGVEFYVKQK